MPYIVFKVDDQQRAVEELIANGINVVNKEEVYGK